MIDELLVTNLGLISRAHLEPGPGLVVITGETGAGKTLLLGALRLLQGATARVDLIGPDGDEAWAEARFALDGSELTAGRRVLREGRSRAYLDGSPVPARALEEHVQPLVEMVGQHDHLRLSRPGALRELVDHRLDDRGRAGLARYQAAWERHQATVRDLEAIGGDRRALEREHDLAVYQAGEIEAAGFEAGAEEDLAERVGRLRHAGELSEQLGSARILLEQSRDGAAAALSDVKRAARLDPSLGAIAAQLEGSLAATDELAVDLRRAMDGLESDPGELEGLEAGLARLGDLKRKYGSTLAEVLEFGQAAAARATTVAELLERADGLEDALRRDEEELAEAGAALLELRRRAGEALVADALVHLEELGFDDPVLELEVTARPAGPEGADQIRILFASDRRLTPGAINRVASGGELSRLVLALALAGSAGEAPVVVFDEIDAGVGGRTALALGRKLAALARERQVFCVTHLPQVAAYADIHMVVERRRNTASIDTVDGEQRLEELSRMLAGLAESDRGREHAEELRTLAMSERR